MTQLNGAFLLSKTAPLNFSYSEPAKNHPPAEALQLA